MPGFLKDMRLLYMRSADDLSCVALVASAVCGDTKRHAMRVCVCLCVRLCVLWNVGQLLSQYAVSVRCGANCMSDQSNRKSWYL